jgi:type I restriction enzyme S subunit
MNELPEGWVWKMLGEVCKAITGTTPPKDDIDNYGTDVPFVKPPQLFDKPINDAPEKLSKKGAALARILPPHSVLVTCIGNLGRTAINNVPVAFNQQINALVPPINLDGKFLFYQAQSPVFKNQLEKLSSATTVAIVNKGKFETIQIPLPPLPIQHAIVTKIEEIFSELDHGVAQLKTARAQLKVYRQAVLKWAFEGRLTNEGVSDGELVEGWKWVKINKVARTIGGYAFKSGEFKSEGKYQVLRMGNVRPGVLRYDENPVFIDDIDESVLSRSLLQSEDIIITQTGTKNKRDYGFTAMIQKPNLLLNQRIAAIRFSESYLPKFFLFFSWTDLFKDQFFANETGNVGQGNVGMKAVTETLIPLPPLPEQHQIVSEIERRLSVCDKLEETIEAGLKQAEVLRAGVLKMAFEGRLV